MCFKFAYIFNLIAIYTVGIYLFSNWIAVCSEAICMINCTPYSYCQCNVTGVGSFTIPTLILSNKFKGDKHPYLI